MRIMSLPSEHGRHSRPPYIFDLSQNAQLIVNHHVMVSRMALLDIIQLALLVDVDQDVAIHRFTNPRPFDLERLEDDVAVRQHRRAAPPLDMSDRVERVWKE